MLENCIFMTKKASNQEMLLTKIAQHPHKRGYGTPRIKPMTYMEIDNQIFHKRSNIDKSYGCEILATAATLSFHSSQNRLVTTSYNVCKTFHHISDL